jgi:hypothetical protein
LLRVARDLAEMPQAAAAALAGLAIMAARLPMAEQASRLLELVASLSALRSASAMPEAVAIAATAVLVEALREETALVAGRLAEASIMLPL